MSTDNLQEAGYALGDNETQKEEIYSRFAPMSIISCSTNLPREVVNLLAHGYERK